MDPLQQIALSQKVLVFGMMSLVPVAMILHLVDSLNRARGSDGRADKTERLPRRKFQLFMGIALLTFFSIAIGCVVYFSV